MGNGIKLGILGAGNIVQETLPLLASLDFDRLYLLGTARSEDRAKALLSGKHVFLEKPATIHIPMPMNQISAFEVTGKEKNSPAVLHDFSEDVHRLSYEFKEFIRVVNEHDTIFTQTILKTSVTAIQILAAHRPY